MKFGGMYYYSITYITYIKNINNLECSKKKYNILITIITIIITLLQVDNIYIITLLLPECMYMRWLLREIILIFFIIWVNRIFYHLS